MSAKAAQPRRTRLPRHSRCGVAILIAAFVIYATFIVLAIAAWYAWAACIKFKKGQGSRTACCEHTDDTCASECATSHSLTHDTTDTEATDTDADADAAAVLADGATAEAAEVGALPRLPDAVAAATSEAELLVACSDVAWGLAPGVLPPAQENCIAYMWLWNHSLPQLADDIMLSGRVLPQLGAGGMGVVSYVGYITLPLGQGRVCAVHKVPRLTAEDLANPAALAAKQQGTQAEISLHLAANGCCPMVPRLFAGDAMICTMLMECCDGKDLNAWLNESLQNCSAGASAQLPSVHMIQIAHSLLVAADLLHKGGIVHRDIKLENVIYEPAAGQLKLLDLGLGARLGADGVCRSGICGTTGFIAPEVHAQHGAGLGDAVQYTAKVDTYAIGVVLVWLSARHEAVRLARDETRPEELLPFIRRNRSARLAELVEGLLCENPNYRLSAHDALAYPFFAGVAHRSPLEVAAGFRSVI